MKKLIYTTAAVLLGLGLQAQIKVWTGGATAIGYTGATPTSGYVMQVSGNSLFSSATGSTSSSAAMIRGNNGISTAGYPEYTWNGDAGTGLFHAALQVIGFSTNSVERMRINNYGNILAGSTSDVAGKVQVTGASNLLTMQLWNSYNYDGGTAVQLNVDRAGTHALMMFNTSVSTTTPRFWIDGTGDVYTQTTFHSSDRNLKENIENLQDALKKVKQLQGVTYNYKKSVSGLDVNLKQIGLIAQDVEKIIPEVVRTSDKGIKSIAYANLVGLLVEAIKEQQTQIDALSNSSQNNSTTGIKDAENINIPLLYQNTPNPFSERTEIKYFVPSVAQEATIYIYNMNGLQLKEFKIANRQNGSVTIEGAQFEAGMYLYTLIVDNKEVETKRMILTK